MMTATGNRSSELTAMNVQKRSEPTRASTGACYHATRLAPSGNLPPRLLIRTLFSAVAAAPTATARRVGGCRTAAVRTASLCSGRPGILREYLDRARVDELLEPRVVDVVRGYLSAFPGAQMQRLAARQGDAQRFPGLVGDGRHGWLLSPHALTFCSSPEPAWGGCRCLASTSLGPRSGSLRRFSASGRALSTWVTCRPRVPPSDG